MHTDQFSNTVRAPRDPCNCRAIWTFATIRVLNDLCLGGILLFDHSSPLRSEAELSDNFHDFFGENFRIAIRFVVLQAPNHPDPENLCGEAFELAWTKTLELRQVPGRAWLYQVLDRKSVV